MKTKYQIAESKAVVGVDQPIKALSMHIQKKINSSMEDSIGKTYEYTHLLRRLVKSSLIFRWTSVIFEHLLNESSSDNVC